MFPSKRQLPNPTLKPPSPIFFLRHPTFPAYNTDPRKLRVFLCMYLFVKHKKESQETGRRNTCAEGTKQFCSLLDKDGLEFPSKGRRKRIGERGMG